MEHIKVLLIVTLKLSNMSKKKKDKRIAVYGHSSRTKRKMISHEIAKEVKTDETDEIVETDEESIIDDTKTKVEPKVELKVETETDEKLKQTSK